MSEGETRRFRSGFVASDRVLSTDSISCSLAAIFARSSSAWVAGSPMSPISSCIEGPGSADGLMQEETYESFKLHAERAFLLAKLTEFDWNVSETARRLDMPRSNLYKKIERLKLSRESS